MTLSKIINRLLLIAVLPSWGLNIYRENGHYFKAPIRNDYICETVDSIRKSPAGYQMPGTFVI